MQCFSEYSAWAVCVRLLRLVMIELSLSSDVLCMSYLSNTCVVKYMQNRRIGTLNTLMPCVSNSWHYFKIRRRKVNKWTEEEPNRTKKFPLSHTLTLTLTLVSCKSLSNRQKCAACIIIRWTRYYCMSFAAFFLSWHAQTPNFRIHILTEWNIFGDLIHLYSKLWKRKSLFLPSFCFFFRKIFCVW